MHPIDSVQLSFNPTSLHILNIILGFIVFGISLDLKVEDFKRISKTPKAFIVGAISQFFLLPLLTFLILQIVQPPPSIALGMILVASCPGGNTSNFMTHLAKGNVALSISMSAFSSALATIMTPFNIAFWGGLDSNASQILQQVTLQGGKMVLMILTLIVIPLFLGLFISHYHPILAKRIHKWMKVFSLIFFGVFVAFAIFTNVGHFQGYYKELSIVVVTVNILAFSVGYFVSAIFKLVEADRRAVALEVGIQNSGLGLVLIFNFFNGLGGMAMVAAFWGVWHIFSGLILSSFWSKRENSEL
jgi:BASS family bile acid:Na+ symporter